MLIHARALLVAVSSLLAAANPSSAQTTTASSSPDWKFTVYPVLAWIATGIELNLDLPPIGNGDNGVSTEILESQFDGAYLGGFSATNDVWRVDVTGMWAAVGGDRPQLPRLQVDVDVIYFYASGGRRVVRDLYVTAGVRRLALKYDILVADQFQYERKPGVWDPLIGLGWHTVRDKFELHVTGEGGGFGVGADIDLAGSVRADWKPIPHFGVTGGYQWLYFEVEDDVRNRPLTVKQTLHGPIVGIGLYF